MSQYYTEKEDFWRESVSVWEKSGLSARQFCTEEGLGYQTFLSWKKRFLEDSDCFVELEEKELTHIEFSCGDISLRVSEDLGSSALSNLILALHQASLLC